MPPLGRCHAVLQHGRSCRPIAGECACCRGLGTESVVVLQRSGDRACCKGLIVSMLDVEAGKLLHDIDYLPHSLLVQLGASAPFSPVTRRSSQDRKSVV